MANADQRAWAATEPLIETERFRPDRALCEDGFCLGVLRAASGPSPYRAVAEAVCPICGRTQPLPSPPDHIALIP